MIADGVTFWSALRSFLRAAEARSLRMVAELVAPRERNQDRAKKTIYCQFNILENSCCVFAQLSLKMQVSWSPGI